jgi:lysophospholipase L1-like esterase
MVDPDNAGFPGITIVQLAELLETGTYLNPGKGGWLDLRNGTWSGDDDRWVEEQELPTSIPPYLPRNPADIILLHIGTNGMPRNRSQDPAVLHPIALEGLETATENVENILMEIDEYESNHNKVMVIVAGIINRACSLSSRYYRCQQRRLPTTKFNELVKDMVTTRIAAGDDIIWVDMETEAQIVYNRPDMIDELHPDESGYQKMAAVWKNALMNITLSPNCNLVRDDLTPPAAPNNLMIIN